MSVFEVRSPAMTHAELSRDEPKPTESAAGTSVARNAAHRADGVEFAFEMSSGLLMEVRRLQSLLGERDKAIQNMKEEKDDLRKSIEGLRTALEQQEQSSSDKVKEVNGHFCQQELTPRNEDLTANNQHLDTMKPDVAPSALPPRYGSPLTPGGRETKDFTPASYDDSNDVFGTTGRGSTNCGNLDVSSMVLPTPPGSIGYNSSKNTSQASGSSHTANDRPSFNDLGRLIAPASPLSPSDECTNTWLPVSIRNIAGRSFLRRPSPSPASPESALPRTPTRLRPQRPAMLGPSVPTASRGLLSTPFSTTPRRQISPLLLGRGSSNTHRKQGEVQASTLLDAQVQVQSWYGDDPIPPAAVSTSKRRKNG